MPARMVQVTIYNNSDYPIVWQRRRDHGFWQDPWWPSNIKDLKKGEQASFRLEFGGIATGVEGWILFKIDVPLDSGWGPKAEFFRLSFSRPFFETSPFHGTCEKYLKDRRSSDSDHPGPALAYVVDHGFGDMETGDHGASPLEVAGAVGFSLYLPGIGMAVEAVPELLNKSFPKRVWWLVQIRNTEGTSSRLPLQEGPPMEKDIFTLLQHA